MYSRNCLKTQTKRDRSRPLGLFATLILASSFCFAQDGPDRTSLSFKQDSNIKIVMEGRAGNLELKASDEFGRGYATTDYQTKGKGFVEYNHTTQSMRWKTRIPWTINRLSRHIKRVAPYMHAYIPKGAELDFNLNITNVGYGSLNFENLQLNKFRFDVNYGDVDISFPTENRSIVRGTAKFHLMSGDLEIYQLGNLKAEKVRINGGIGELSVDFGPKLHQDMNVTVDHDIGAMDLFIPRGTKVAVSGTSRNLAPYGFEKAEKGWITANHHQNSPLLTLRIKGPLGDLVIEWK